MRQAVATEKVGEILDDLREQLIGDQQADGSWSYLLEGSVLPDAYQIIAERLFPPADDDLVADLARAIVKRQRPDGGWGLCPDDDGDYSTTLEAYLALRLAGGESTALARARSFLQRKRGKGELSNLTRVAFATFGILPWSAVPTLPPEQLLWPARWPLSILDFVSFTRVHLPPIMILAALNARLRLPCAEELRWLCPPRFAKPGSGASALRATVEPAFALARRISSLTHLRPRALEDCRKFIVSRVEPDGTVGSYILSTLFSMCALRALDAKRHDALIFAMKQGLRSIVYRGVETRMQPCSSTLWDTALNLSLLRRLGVDDDSAVVRRAVSWLLEREVQASPDAQMAREKIAGWGFQAVNRYYPDVDDTCAVLEALEDLRSVQRDRAAAAYTRGLSWVLRMQNRDGGWSAFDRNCASPLLERWSFNDMRRAMIDPSTADMTGRTLSYVAPHLSAPQRASALRWLDGDQRSDGSWFGRWGIAFIYGTWAALLGYARCGKLASTSAHAQRGCDWLARVQNSDGGWGESCLADQRDVFVSHASTPSQTAWAVEGLCAVAAASASARSARDRGLSHLLNHYQTGYGWPEDYPTGAGFAGKLYLYYHNYRNVWPARALLRFARP